MPPKTKTPDASLDASPDAPQDAPTTPAETDVTAELLAALTAFLEHLTERVLGKHEGTAHDARTRELFGAFHTIARQVFDPEGAAADAADSPE